MNMRYGGRGENWDKKTVANIFGWESNGIGNEKLLPSCRGRAAAFLPWLSLVYASTHLLISLISPL